jgi:hypothetical protein
VVVVPSDAQPRLSLIPWLTRRYGIEQVQVLSLSCAEWDALVAGRMDSPRLERFKDRLALAQLGRPEAIVVVGGAGPHPSCDEPPRARRAVQLAVTHLRSLGLPIEVIGAWVNEHWAPDDCLIESEELPTPRPAPPPHELEARDGDGDRELYAGLTSA